MKILMITTGGTLACKQTNDGLMPLLKGKDILEFAKDTSNIDVYDFRLIDSSIMTDEDRKELSELIFSKKDEYDSFIITHGTDSLSFTAAYLDCTLENFYKTVVLTASQLPLVFDNTDAIANLNLAIKTANADSIGVCVAIHGSVISANNITKINTNGFSAFDSIDKNQTLKIKHKSSTPMKLLTMSDRKIDIVYITPVLSPLDILKKDVFSDIVVLTLGSGGMLKSQLEAFKTLFEKGVNIHLKSQCLYGDVQSVYEAHKASKEFNIPKKSSLEYLIYSIAFDLI